MTSLTQGGVGPLEQDEVYRETVWVRYSLRMNDCHPHLVHCSSIAREYAGYQMCGIKPTCNHVTRLDLKQYEWKVMDGNKLLGVKREPNCCKRVSRTTVIQGCSCSSVTACAQLTTRLWQPHWTLIKPPQNLHNFVASLQQPRRAFTRLLHSECWWTWYVNTLHHVEQERGRVGYDLVS